MVSRAIVAATLAVLPLMTVDAAAQQSRPTAATQAVATAPVEGAEVQGSLQGTITEIKGMVQVRSADDQKWVPATVGMAVGEGTEFRTGPRSAVRVVIP